MSIISLSKSAWRDNVATLREASLGQELWPCIKANAYGHGTNNAITCLNDLVDGWCTVSTREALAANKLTMKPILALNIVDPDDLPLLKSNELIHLPLADEMQLKWYNNLDFPIQIHVEIDTGMARTGWRWKTLADALKILNQLGPHIKVAGFFSHLAAAGEHDDFTTVQYRSWIQWIEWLRPLYPEALFHFDKSASLLAPLNHPPLPAVRLGARPGISLYGYGDLVGTYSGLTPVLSWKTSILSVRDIDKNEAVGYGLTFVAQQRTRIATIPVGYADGLPRAMSNRGQVLVRGKRALIRGRVCMNLTMIEVEPDVEAGEEVVLIGQQGRNNISAYDWGRWSGTTHYEIVSRLSCDLPRQIA